MKAAALKGALSDRARNDRVHVVDSLVAGQAPSTKTALATLAGLSTRRRFLVVLARGDNIPWLSLRNAPHVHIIAVDQLNTSDVLPSHHLVLSKAPFDTWVANSDKRRVGQKC